MSRQDGFALWITGLPASGKSSVTAELVKQLRAGNIPTVVLESDAMRKILTPEPDYTQDERARFYKMLVLIAKQVTQNGINVIFDATGNKRAYREYARGLISRFLEIYIDTPLEECRKRDPKGIYARAASGRTTTVPGVQEPYEHPLKPDLTLDGRASPGFNAERILEKLKQQFLYV